MWKVPKEVEAFKGSLNYVDSCPNEPLSGHALCEEHCLKANSLGVPSTIKEYIAYLSCESIYHNLSKFM